jgi:hypothetical protein
MSLVTPNAKEEPVGASSAGEVGTTVSLVGAGVENDRCSECGTALASDQRYCVECGTRRGAPRFSVHRPAEASVSGVAATPRMSRGSSSSVTPLAGLAALLLAIAVGVLIGLAASGTTNVHVVVSGGAASTTAAGAGSTSSSSGAGKTSSGSTSSTSGASVKPGGKCTAGTSGCQNGKQTGNFFPSGG